MLFSVKFPAILSKLKLQFDNGFSPEMAKFLCFLAQMLNKLYVTSFYALKGQKKFLTKQCFETKEVEKLEQKQKKWK